MDLECINKKDGKFNKIEIRVHECQLVLFESLVV